MKPVKGTFAKLTLAVRGEAGRDRREFLPAALEVLETPASPTGRLVAISLTAFFAIALAWAIIGRIDIIATAQGKIVPSGRTKTVQPLDSGIVTAIHVRDGDQVKAGQVLIELDRSVLMAERSRILLDLRRAGLDAARLTALRAGLASEGGPSGFAPPADALGADIERARATMAAQAAAQQARLASIDQQIAQKQAEAESIAAVVARLEAGLPLVEQVADIREKVMKMEFGNRIAHLDAQLKLTDQRQEIGVQRHRALETVAARQALAAQRDQAAAEYAGKIFSDLTEAQLKIEQHSEDLAKADQKLAEKSLRAPVDGKVQQLMMHTVGGVVTPAQPVMAIVPADSRIEVEATILNRDIGFVAIGQEAEVKVDTFNFTRYGLLNGKVVNVSRDAITRENPATKAKPDGGALANSSEPQGQEFIYAARVTLAETRMQIEDKWIDLAPGMAVTVEIKTGDRRIIEYVLSPLLRYRQESLRER